MIESAEEFVRLRCSEQMEEYVRAAHEDAPLEVWLEVIERYPDMKPWVVHNKTVPLSILELLSHAPDPNVRWSVAMKRKAGRAILERLAADPDASVRVSVASNRKTPLDVVERLTADPDYWVAESARERLADRAEADRRRGTGSSS